MTAQLKPPLTEELRDRFLARDVPEDVAGELAQMAVAAVTDRILGKGHGAVAYCGGCGAMTVYSEIGEVQH